MKRIGTILGIATYLALNWGILMYHVGTFRPPVLPTVVSSTSDEGAGAWAGRETFGINQLVLKGNPFVRGLESGRLTEPLLRAQEEALTNRLFKLIPRWFFLMIEPFGVAYFHGIERYLEPWMTQEMYGVSKSAPREFDILGDGFTRQITYHGIHEIGQMMVDQRGEGMGCTVAAAPTKTSWIVGRNFDFEGGRIFDREKIMKWVFPETGYAYVSVIWAGMVGAVTGVNERGLFLSINAAGTKDFRRIGTPSTLVLLKILERASTADEALAILREETVFITDIFVLLDSRAGKLFRVEKSPLATEIIPLNDPSIVANHLVGRRFTDDPTNLFRRHELTSEARQLRGEELLRKAFPGGRRATKASESIILSILRDKGEVGGEPLLLGNRSAIDALIATHSVIFNGDDQSLYVGKGPGVSGEFLGFDLTASFRARTPIRRGSLPSDPRVTSERFANVRTAEEKISLAVKELKRGNCTAGSTLLDGADLFSLGDEKSYDSLAARGDFEACRGDPTAARSYWERALKLHPAYLAERNALAAKISKAKRTGEIR